MALPDPGIPSRRYDGIGPSGRDGGMAPLGVMDAVGGNAADPLLQRDLRQQVRQNGRLTDAVARHLHRANFKGFGIDTDVDLAPWPAAAGYLLDVVVVSGSSVAASRDNHYNNPPHYLVLEPGDTSGRTRNLQQTNTNGYKLQDATEDHLEAAKRMMDGWTSRPKQYSTSPEYQAQLRQLLSALPYRLDTNYAKMDRIVHEELEAFKTRVLNTKVHGLKVREWDQLFRGPQNLQKALVKAVEDGDETKAASIRKRLEAAEEKVKNELMILFWTRAASTSSPLDQSWCHSARASRAFRRAPFSMLSIDGTRRARRISRSGSVTAPMIRRGHS